MKASVYLYDNRWPYAKRQQLRNASRIDYNLDLADWGKFQFELPSQDATVHQGNLDGMLAGIVSDQGAPDFIGRVEAMHEDGLATCTVIGREWLAVLGDRTTEQAAVYTGSAGRAAMDIVRIANATLATGIEPRDVSGGAPLDGPYEPRANSVFAALGELAALSGDEYGRTYVCGQRAQCWLSWQSTVGYDLRNVCHVWDRSLVERRYELDRLNEAETVTVIGATGTYADRPSASVNAAGARLAQVNYTVPLPPHVRSSIAARQTQTDDAAATDRAAAAAAARALSVALGKNAETIIVTISGNTDWGWFQLGNVVMIRIPRIRLGAGFVTPFRILGIQPDHENGVIHLVGKVVI